MEEIVLLCAFLIVRLWRILMAPYRESPDAKPIVGLCRDPQDLDCPWEGRTW